jgi:FkbM family methyltransferase
MNKSKDILEIEQFVLNCFKKPEVFSNGSSDHELLESLLTDFFNEQFELNANNRDRLVNIPFFGQIVWPDENYGNLDSSCFFGVIEFLVWLSFIFPKRKNKYWDVGAHMGIDTILMSLIGQEVTCFEPDPNSFLKLENNLALNKLENTNAVNAGLSWINDEVEFVQVSGNTTANHIKGARDAYGELNYIKANLVDYRKYNAPDFCKINVEGYEKDLFQNIHSGFWDTCDAIVEVHSEDIMESILEVSRRTDLKIYPQKIGFRKTISKVDCPLNNKEGYIIVSKKNLDSNWFKSQI